MYNADSSLLNGLVGTFSTKLIVNASLPPPPPPPDINSPDDSVDDDECCLGNHDVILLAKSLQTSVETLYDPGQPERVDGLFSALWVEHGGRRYAQS